MLTCHLPFVIRLVVDILATAGAPGVSHCIEAPLTVRVPGRKIVAWEEWSRPGYPGVWVCAACDCTGEVPGQQGKGGVMLSIRLGTTCFDALAPACLRTSTVEVPGCCFPAGVASPRTPTRPRSPRLRLPPPSSLLTPSYTPSYTPPQRPHGTALEPP